jgi:hypothetical protein
MKEMAMSTRTGKLDREEWVIKSIKFLMLLAL